MKKNTLYALWGGLSILCAGLGFIPAPAGFGKAVLMLLALGFFVPGALLLYGAVKTGDRKEARRVRTISLISLGATLLALVLNFLSVTASTAVGNFLYGLLVVVSVPMVCSQYWAASLFLWGCLLAASLIHMPKEK